MQLTKQERKAVDELSSRSKGWPVGLWIEKRMAHNLVQKGLAEWAVPLYPLADTDKIASVRLTTAGSIHVGRDWCDHLQINAQSICRRCKQKVYPNKDYRKPML